jgi:hypothetical protein
MSNAALNQAARARAQREGRTIPAAATSNPDYECPVCYTTDPSAGVVSPTCGHKICITCYSTVLLQGGSCARCPSCRADYPRSSLAAPAPAPAPASAPASASASASAPAPAPVPVQMPAPVQISVPAPATYRSPFEPRDYDSPERRALCLQILANDRALEEIRAARGNMRSQYNLGIMSESFSPSNTSTRRVCDNTSDFTTVFVGIALGLGIYKFTHG